jgi:hypothetical protein
MLRKNDKNFNLWQTIGDDLQRIHNHAIDCYEDLYASETTPEGRVQMCEDYLSDIKKQITFIENTIDGMRKLQIIKEEK